MTIECHNCGALLEDTDGSSHLTVSCHRCGQPNEPQSKRGAGAGTIPSATSKRPSLLLLASGGAVSVLMVVGVVAYLLATNKPPLVVTVASASAPIPVAAPTPVASRRSQLPPRRRLLPTASPSASAGGDAAELPSCKEAQRRYTEQAKPGEERGKPLGARAYRRVLNHGRYLAPCQVPAAMGVKLCVAIQRGRAVGITVDTTPRDAEKQACVARQVSRLRFPAGPGLDIARTTFAPAE